MRRVMWILAALGCGAPKVVAPPAPGPAPAAESPAEPASDVIDSGTFVFRVGAEATVLATERFTLRRRGPNLVLRVSAQGSDPSRGEATEGELEVDARWRPLRADYRTRNPADIDTIRLGGSPLTLDVIPADSRPPEQRIATWPVDVFIEGPGVSAMTALCQIDGDVTLSTIGSKGSSHPRWIEAYRLEQTGTRRRVVFEAADNDFELVCDGDRLIAGVVRAHGLSFVREGREAELAALQQQAAPPAKDWKQPEDDSSPWDPLHTYLVGDVLVTRDARRRTNRLTSYDVKTGARLAQRTIRVALYGHVMCEPLPAGRLVCEHVRKSFLQVLDARTLTDQVDLFPAVRNVVPDAPKWSWQFIDRIGETLVLRVDAGREVRLDLGTRVATEVPRVEHAGKGLAEPQRCYPAYDKLTTGKVTWRFERLPGPDRLVRTSGGKQTEPVLFGWEYPSLLTCAPRGGGAYVITHEEDRSVLASLAPDTKLRWQRELGGHPDEIHVLGDRMIVELSDPDRRLVAVDTRTGAIVWVAPAVQADGTGCASNPLAHGCP